MEWSKAKTILIILFLILNVFLFGSILYSSSSLGLNSDYVKYVNTFLESKNITLKASIPSYHSSSGMIDYEDQTIDKNHAVNFFFGHSVSPSNEAELPDTLWVENEKVLEIGNNIIKYTDSTPDRSLSIKDKDKLLKELAPYFEGLGIDRNEYVADIYQEQNDAVYVKFIKKYKGHLLFDVYIDFYITPAGIESINMVPKVAISTIVPDEILSAYQVMVVGMIPENSIIKEICFGYKKLQEGDLNDNPVWRIRYSDGHDEFYNAYTGERF